MEWRWTEDYMLEDAVYMTGCIVGLYFVNGMNWIWLCHIYPWPAIHEASAGVPPARL